MQTVPSILEKNVNDLISQINKLSPHFPRFQIDIADGIFVPNRTVQIDEIISYFKKQSDNETMKQYIFDFHLMVKDYKTEIKKLEKLKNFIKINLIFIHLSVTTNYELLTTNHSFSIGLVLNPKDQVSDLTKHYSLNTIPCIQIMSVTPGVQGNPFLPETLNKIGQLRNIGYRKEIFLDGAVNDKTLPFINEQKFKPDVVCPGSFLTKAKDLEKNVKYLEKFVKS